MQNNFLSFIHLCIMLFVGLRGSNKTKRVQCIKIEFVYYASYSENAHSVHVTICKIGKLRLLFSIQSKWKFKLYCQFIAPIQANFDVTFFTFLFYFPIFISYTNTLSDCDLNQTLYNQIKCYFFFIISVSFSYLQQQQQKWNFHFCLRAIFISIFFGELTKRAMHEKII